MDLTFWLAVAGIVAAFGSLGVAWITKVQTDKNQRENYVSLFAEKMENWFEKTLSIVKTMSSFKINTKDKNNAKELDGLLQSLSIQIDLGRMYFTNLPDNRINQNKPELFKGQRVVPLSLLVMYHHLFEQGKQVKNEDVIRNIERAWISETALHIKNINKSHTLVDYTLTDKANILLPENLENPELKQIFKNQDLIKYVKLANEVMEKSGNKHVTEESIKQYEQTKGEKFVKNFKRYISNKENTAESVTLQNPTLEEEVLEHTKK